jgi:antitoxin Phd
MDWQMAEAKNRFSEVMNRAISDGPQWVRRRKDAVVVLSEDEYQRLAGNRPDFKQYLMQGEDFDGLNLARDQSLGRDVAL